MDVLAHYRVHHPQALKKAGAESKEWKLVRARLREGSTVEDLKKAIDGYHLSPFHLGQNDTGQRHLGLDLIMRDGSHVAKGIEYSERGPPRPMSDREVTNRAAVEGYRALMEARR